MSQVAVLPLQVSETGSAAHLLARAFQDDPIWAGVFPRQEGRHERMVGQFAPLLRFNLAAGSHVIKTENNGAVAVWRPPDKPRAGLSAIGPAMAMGASGIGMPLRAWRFYGWMSRNLGPLHKRLVPEPHWYLMLLGTHPARQGSGLGTALVQDGLMRADAAGMRAYLETETADVRFYEHLGFEVRQELDTPLPDCRMWLMVRPPQSR